MTSPKSRGGRPRKIRQTLFTQHVNLDELNELCRLLKKEFPPLSHQTAKRIASIKFMAAAMFQLRKKVKKKGRGNKIHIETAALIRNIAQALADQTKQPIKKILASAISGFNDDRISSGDKNYSNLDAIARFVLGTPGKPYAGSLRQQTRQASALVISSIINRIKKEEDYPLIGKK